MDEPLEKKPRLDVGDPAVDTSSPAKEVDVYITEHVFQGPKISGVIKQRYCFLLVFFF